MSDQRPARAALSTLDATTSVNRDDDEEACRVQHRANVLSVLTQLPRVASEKAVTSDAGMDNRLSSAVPATESSDVEQHGSKRGHEMDKSRCTRPAFTGLSNQGATCYMNSLLQSMFMTPEFRQGLYRWTCCDTEQNVVNQERNNEEDGAAAAAAEDDDDDDEREQEQEEDNIPLQLQNLFAKLQLTSQVAISTKELTKSFGWTGADVFQQHDVQELCRVLLDALERSFKDTVNEQLVNELFQGALKDYVQCRECGYESCRIDTFLDLSLVIRPFGSMDMMKTIEEAIEFFLRPEVLDQENQWMCDRCNVKRDAIKGLKFSKLPYILMLQLKRFDFDYATMNRIKLHNKVTFPKYLDMNSYVSDEHGGARGKIARKMSMERHVLEATNHHKSSEGTTATLSSPPVTPLCASLGEKAHRLSSMHESQPIEYENGEEKKNDDSEDGDLYGTTSPDTWNSALDPAAMIKRFGPHVYELYSVLIHSGSAMGGHYYAYIKSLESGKWYNFNDANVSEISDGELKTAFGGATGTCYNAHYSTCAYMLLYRLVSPEKNVNVIPPDNVPQFLKDRIRADEDKIRRLEKERLELSKKIQMKFYMKGAKPKNIEKTIYLYKDLTIREALELVREEFAKDEHVIVPSIDNVRLRGYNDYNCLLSDTYNNKENMTLSSLGFYAGQQMFLEVKSDSEMWEEHDPAKLQLFIRRFIDPESDDSMSKSSLESLMARCVQVEDNADIASLCALIANKFSVSANRKIRLIKKSATTYSISAAKVLNTNEETHTLNLRLKMDLHLINGTELYFEETPDLSFASPAEAFFEREANMITVNFKYLARPAQPIRIDRRSTVRTLKESISLEIGLPPNAFKLLRGINSAGVEIKAIDSTLSKLSIGSNHTVFALEGTPLNTGEYNFRLVFYNPARACQIFTENHGSSNQDQAIVTSASADSSDSEDSYNIDEVLVTTAKDDSMLSFVSHIVISEEMLVEDIRKKVWNELVGKNLVNANDNWLTPSHIRLRDLRQNTMTNILVDGQKLVEASKLAVYEGRSIVAEILTKPETTGVNHRIVEFAYVDRATWRFVHTLRHEAVISTIEEESHPDTYLAKAASAALSIPAERLRFARVPYQRDSIDIIEVVTYNYLPAASFARKGSEYHELFLVIDVDVNMTYMNSHDRQRIHRFLTKRSEKKAQALCTKYPPSGNGLYQHQKPKEAALVIRARSRTSEHRGAGSVGSSSGKTSNGVNIRTQTDHTEKTASRQHVSSDTDDEDDTDFMADKNEALDMDLFGGLS